MLYRLSYAHHRRIELSVRYEWDDFNLGAGQREGRASAAV
jgi:hypothetical protein